MYAPNFEFRNFHYDLNMAKLLLENIDNMGNQDELWQFVDSLVSEFR